MSDKLKKALEYSEQLRYSVNSYNRSKITKQQLHDDISEELTWFLKGGHALILAVNKLRAELMDETTQQ